MRLRTLIVTGLAASVLAIPAMGQDAPMPASKPTPAPAAAKAKDPTISEILSKYESAIGGDVAARKIKNRTVRGTVTLSPLGLTGTVVGYSAPENKTVTFLEIGGLGSFAEGFDGTTAWSKNPLQGSRIKSGEEVQRAKLTGAFYRETNLDSIYKTFELVGRETVTGRQAYVVKATPEGLSPDTLYFDVDSGHLLRYDTTLVSPEGRIPVSTYFDDLREVDGVIVAFSSRTKLPQYEMQIALTEVTHNTPIEAKVFSQP